MAPVKPTILPEGNLITQSPLLRKAVLGYFGGKGRPPVGEGVGACQKAIG